jgi:CRP-like cAMP-binding protein
MNQNDITIEQLRKIKSLARFKDEELLEFLHFVELTPIAHDTELFHEGNPGDAMYLILDGQMQVYTEKPDGEIEILKILQTGEAFGDLALFYHTKRAASVKALKDSQLLKLTAASLENLTAKQAGLASKFLFSMANSLSQMYAHHK